jgi:hypothetical protein
MAHCLWNNDCDSHRHHLANWQLVSMKKEFGGLGVPNLRELNLCLLGSWVSRYCVDRDKIWKNLIDFKYRTCEPSIFTCGDNGVSNFWKGVMWAARVAKMGYRWKVGNGKKIRFWEDVWIGSSSLAIQYWEIYCIVNEQNHTIAEIWDGTHLKCSFRRCVDRRLYQLWEELVSIADALVLTEDEDEPVWQFSSNGIYSYQSLYAVINFRGVTPVFIPAVWKIVVPPRIHFFLWLLSHNKLLTRDNLEKTKKIGNNRCLFCDEMESVHHLFFGCVVARQVWLVVSEVAGFELGINYESIAKLWLCNKKFGVINIFSSAVCWGLWKLRNALCFQDVAWKNMKQLWFMVLMIRCWSVLVPMKMAAGFENALASMEKLVSGPLLIEATPLRRAAAPDDPAGAGSPMESLAISLQGPAEDVVDDIC